MSANEEDIEGRDVDLVDISDADRAEPGSPIEALRAKREELRSRKTEIFHVPGYDGLLAVEYRLLGYDAAREIGRKHRQKNDPRRLINSQIDTLIAACVNFHYVDKDGKYQTLDGDNVVRYDKRLAEILEIEDHDSARQIVLGVFQNEIALIDHHVTVMDWMRTGVREEDEEGEV